MARPSQRGLTLIEMLMFIVIVGIALAGIVRVMSFTTANSADPVRRKQALMLAEALLEEVQQSGFSFCDPASDNAGEARERAVCVVGEEFGPEPGNMRPFDNINDYVAQAGQPAAAFNNAAGVLVDATNAPMGLNGYAASVTVVPEALGTGAAMIAAAGQNADVNVLRITVTVTYDGQTLVLDGYRTRNQPRFVQ